MSLRKAVVGLLSVGVLFAVATRVQAVPLAPGQVVVPTAIGPISGTNVPGCMFTYTLTGTNALNQTRFTATLFANVINEGAANPLGGLTFIYQVTNSATSLDSIDRLSTLSFAGFLTDVNFVDGAGTNPALADRTPTIGGAVVGFELGAENIGLIAGAQSDLLVIRTNAPTVTSGATQLINGGVVSAITCAPAAVVPEPGVVAFAAVNGLGVLGLMVRARRRRSA